MPDYFDSIIPRVTSVTTGVVTIPQAVRKMNGDRPTISALQKAGRLAERRMTLPTPQDDEDHEAFAAELEEQLQAEALAAEESAQEEGEESDLSLPEVIEVSSDDHDSLSTLQPAPARKTPRGKGKGKGKRKEQEKAGNSSGKRKVRFEDEEEEEEAVRRSVRVSKKTKKAKGAKTTL
jgi:hypothetical protein